MHNSLVLASIAALSPAQGCSLLFVEGPPAERLQSQPRIHITRELADAPTTLVAFHAASDFPMVRA